MRKVVSNTFLKPIFSLLVSQGLLNQSHSASAAYLFQQDKFYDMSLDTGDKSVQCGRKVDCLKLWLMWKALGSEGFAARIDKAFALARFGTPPKKLPLPIIIIVFYIIDFQDINDSNNCA